MEKFIDFLIPATVYIVGGGLLIFILFFTGCSSIEVLDGLCYSDKTGTYVCLDEDEPTRWDECEKWVDPETWSQCMIA
tara:strand:+ start:421 stop:654 length:234 start_codon:yes stop_codon:yes gene_type:complete